MAPPDPYRGRPAGSAPRVFFHRPERSWRVLLALLLLLAPLFVTADLFSTATSIRCERAAERGTCHIESSSVLRPQRRDIDLPKIIGVSAARMMDLPDGPEKMFVQLLIEGPPEGNILLYASAPTAEANARLDQLDEFFKARRIKASATASVAATFGSFWRRTKTVPVVLLMAFVVLIWACRRTRITMDEGRKLIRIERLRWPLRKESHTLASDTLRTVTIIAIHASPKKDLRLALELSSGELFPLVDFRPTPARAPAERERLAAFLGE